MEKLRSHIVKWATLVSVTIGLAFCLIRPVETQHTRDSFARWVQTLQDNSELPDQLRAELNELNSFDGDFQQLVERASTLIKRYDGQFKLLFPINTDQADSLPDQLVVEWNFFYQLGDLFDGLPVPQIKSTFTHHLSFWGTESNQHNWDSSLFSTYTLSLNSEIAILGSAMQPMIHGIAIGAP